MVRTRDVHIDPSTVNVELHPGGRWDMDMVDNETGEHYPIRSQLKIVIPPEYLEGGEVSGAAEMSPADSITLRIWFHDHGAKTRMTLHQGPFTPEFRDMTRDGWESSFVKIDAILEVQERMTTEYAKSSDGTRIAFESNGSGPGARARRRRDVPPQVRPGRAVHRGAARRVHGRHLRPARARRERRLVDLPSRARGRRPPGRDRDRRRQAVRARFSSGAGLAYRAAGAGVPMSKLIGYEAPYVGLRGGRDYVATSTGSSPRAGTARRSTTSW